jgi:hypothetical protein
MIWHAWHKITMGMGMSMNKRFVMRGGKWRAQRLREQKEG